MTKHLSVDVVFMGFPIAIKDSYYLEADPMDLRMDNMVHIILSIMGVLFLSIDLCIMTVMVLGNFFFDNLERYWDLVMSDPYWGPNELILGIAIYLGFSR